MGYKKNNKKKTAALGISLPIALCLATAWIITVSATFLKDRQIIWGLSHFFELKGSFDLVQFLRLGGSYLFSTIMFLGTIIGIHLIGDVVLGVLKPDFKSRSERSLMSIGLGAGIFALAMFGFALAGLLYPAFMYLLWIGGVVFGFKRAKTAAVSFSFKGLKFTTGTKIILFITGAVVLFNFIMAFTPEIFYDTLNYHLGVGNIYSQFGRYVELPYKYHTSFPLIPQMLFMFSIIIDSTAAAKLLNFVFAVFTALAVYVFSRDHFKSPETGLYAAAIYLFVPNVLFRTWTATTDTMLTFFVFISLWAAINYLKGKNIKWLVVSGVTGGFFIGSKFTGIFFIAGLFMLICMFCSAKVATRIKKGFLWAGIMFLFFMPWLVRNYIETGNPVHPFLSTSVTKVFPYTMLDRYELYEQPHHKFTRSERIKNLPLLLWNLPTAGGKMEGDYASSDYYMTGAIFLLFIPLLIIFKDEKNKNKILKYLFVFSAVSFVFWGIQTDKVKYFAPAFPALALLTAAGVERMGKSGSVGRVIATGTLAFHLSANFLFMSSLAQIGYEPFSVVTGMVSRDEFLSVSRMTYPHPSYNAFKYVHENLPEEIKILVSGDAKTYHLDRPHISFAASQLDPFTVYMNMEGVNTGKELYQFLEEKEYTHIIFNAPEAYRTAGYGFLDYGKDEVEILSEMFENHLNLIYSRQGVFLYEVVESSESPADNPILEVFMAYNNEKAQNFLENAIEESGTRRRELLERTVEKADRVLNSGIDSAQSYYFAAYSYYLLGEGDKALHHARQAAEIESRFEEFYRQIAEALR